MARIDFENAAFSALKLPQPTDLSKPKGVIYIGDVYAANEQDAYLKMASMRRKSIIGARDALEEQFGQHEYVKPHETQNFISSFIRNHMFVDFETYQHIIKNIKTYWRDTEGLALSGIQFVSNYNERRHTNDLKGYRQYVSEKDPDFSAMAESIMLPVWCLEKERWEHTHVVGETGTGKTTLLKTLIYSYVKNEPETAVVIIEPHGDFVNEVAQWAEFVDSDRLIYIRPKAFADHIPHFNPLQKPQGAQADEFVLTLLASFEDLMQGTRTELTSNMRTLLHYCLRVLVDNNIADLKNLRRFMRDDGNNDLIKLGKSHHRSEIADFFANEYGQNSYKMSKDAVRNRINSILAMDAADSLFSGENTFDFEAAINSGKIIVFGIAEGDIGIDATQALGKFIINRLEAMAKRRTNSDRASRNHVHVFVDECQNFVSARLMAALDEVRKFGVHFTLAHQRMAQLTQQQQATLLGATNVKIAFSTKPDNKLASAMKGIKSKDLYETEKYHAWCQLSKYQKALMVKMSGGVADNAMSMTSAEWQRVLEQQKTAYYAPINASTPTDIQNKPPESRSRRQLR